MTVRRILLVLVLLGGGARILWVAHAGTPPRFTSDPEAYLLQGQTIAKGNGYTNPLIDIANRQRRHDHQPLLAEQPTSFYPPGYPAFIAVVAWTVWHTPIPDGGLVRAIEYVQAIIGALTILLVFMLTRRVFDIRTALIAATIVAFYPNLVTITATLQLETVFIALSLLAVLVLVPAASGEDTRVVRLVAGGALTGAVALVRPTIALIVLAFLVTRWIAGSPWRKLMRDFALVTIAMIAIILPWTIRNAVALHAFVPVSTGIGPALCMSRNQEATGGLDTTILVRQCSAPDQKFAPGTGDTEVNSYATKHAIRWVAAHPLEEVKFWWWRTDLAYRHDTSGIDQYERLMSRRARRTADAVSDDASFIVLGLALIGAVIVVTGRRPARGVFLVATTLAFAAVPAILFGDPRYRVPAEPLFAILAAVPLAFCFAALTRGRGVSASTATATRSGGRG